MSMSWATQTIALPWTEQEVQVVPESPVELVEDEDVPLVEVIGREPRPDPWTLLDRLAARDVQVLGLGHHEDVLPLAVLLDGLRLRVEVRRDIREMRKPLRYNASELRRRIHRH
jgi:hypothetical protein